MTLHELHVALALYGRQRLEPALPDASPRTDPHLAELERDFVERERAAVSPRAIGAPTDPDAFVRWFEGLRQTGPGQGDPLFPWLATHAPLAPSTGATRTTRWARSAPSSCPRPPASRRSMRGFRAWAFPRPPAATSPCTRHST